MPRFAAFPALLATVLLSGACGSGEGPNDAALLRLMHARTGAPAVNLLANGETVVDGIAFSEASEFAEVAGGTTNLEIRPAGGGAALSTRTTELEPGSRYTLLFSHSGADSELRLVADTATGLPLEPPPTEPGDTGAIPGESKVKLRMIHNASDAPPIDVYLTNYGAALGGPSIEPFTYGVGLDPAFPGYFERDPGTWQVRFTADGTEEVLADTGPIQMAAGQVRSVILFSSDSAGLGIAIVRER